MDKDSNRRFVPGQLSIPHVESHLKRLDYPSLGELIWTEELQGWLTAKDVPLVEGEPETEIAFHMADPLAPEMLAKLGNPVNRINQVAHEARLMAIDCRAKHYAKCRQAGLELSIPFDSISDNTELFRAWFEPDGSLSLIYVGPDAERIEVAFDSQQRFREVRVL